MKSFLITPVWLSLCLWFIYRAFWRTFHINCAWISFDGCVGRGGWGVTKTMGHEYCWCFRSSERGKALVLLTCENKQHVRCSFERNLVAASPSEKQKHSVTYFRVYSRYYWKSARFHKTLSRNDLFMEFGYSLTLAEAQIKRKKINRRSFNCEVKPAELLHLILW